MKCFNLICGFAVGVAALLVSSHSYGATVKKISTSRGLILIDEGSNQGVSYRDKICVYSDSGSKVACGLVVKAKEDSSFVVISQARVRKVRKGMQANSAGASESYAQGEEGDYEQESSSSSSSSRSSGGIRAKLNYVLSVIPQTRTTGPVPWDATADNRGPKLPEDAQGNPNWGTPSNLGLVGKMRLIGVAGEVDFGITKSIRAAVGLRFKLGGYADTFDGESIEQATMISELSGNSLGGYVDAYLINRPLGPVNLSAGLGLDVEMNSVTFKTGRPATTGATTEDGGAASKIGTALFEGTASGTIISARIPIEISFPVMKKLSIGVKLVPMYSIIALGRSINFTTEQTSGTSPPAGTAGTGAAGEENSADEIKYNDYFSALGVEPKGLAFEIYPISLQYSF